MSARKFVKRGQRYGCIADPNNMPVARGLQSGEIRYTSEWIYHGLPSDSQGDLGACVGYAWAGWMEAMVRKYVGRYALAPGVQIDGEAIWRKGRRMFWAGEPEEDGGLLLEHGFEAALSMGILPPGARLARLRNNDPASIGRVLEQSPLVIAQAVHAGWNKPRSDNGFIPFAKGSPYSGHAVWLGGITEQRSEPYYLIPNSWGTDWAWHGVCMLSAGHYQQNTLAMPAYAIMPNGWTGHGGWRKWIKVRPETAR